MTEHTKPDLEALKASSFAQKARQARNDLQTLARLAKGRGASPGTLAALEDTARLATRLAAEADGEAMPPDRLEEVEGLVARASVTTEQAVLAASCIDLRTVALTFPGVKPEEIGLLRQMLTATCQALVNVDDLLTMFSCRQKAAREGKP